MTKIHERGPHINPQLVVLVTIPWEGSTWQPRVDQGGFEAGRRLRRLPYQYDRVASSKGKFVERGTSVEESTIFI